MSKKIIFLFLIVLGIFSFFSVIAQVKQDPVAVIEGPDEVYKCADLTLDGSNSFDPDGGNITFEWKKDNQTLGTEDTFNDNGGSGSITDQYDLIDLIISLIVTDDEGDTKSRNKTIDILENKAPIILEVENSDEDGVVTEQEEFFLEVKITSGSKDDSLEYWWDREYNNKPIQDFFEISDLIPEKKKDDYLVTETSKIKFTPKKIFNGEGNEKITVILKVTAKDKCEQTSEKEIPITIIRNTLPLAKIFCLEDPCQFSEGSSLSNKLNAGISLSGSYFIDNELIGKTDPTSLNPDTIEKYEWNWTFIDKATEKKSIGSQTKTDPNFSKTFNDSGDVVLTLKIIDSHQNKIPKEPFTDGSYTYSGEGVGGQNEKEASREDVITDKINIKIVEAQDDPPIADISATKTYWAITDPIDFTLNGSNSSDDRGIKKYIWKISHPVYYPPGNEDFIESTEETSDYTFGYLGDFKITLTVRDTGPPYLEDEDTIIVTVGEEVCICTEWMTYDCGEENCLSTEKIKKRFCKPIACEIQKQCVEDPSCIGGPPPPVCNDNGTCDIGETVQNCPEDCAQCNYAGRVCDEGKVCENKRCITPLVPIEPFLGTYNACTDIINENCIGEKIVTYDGLVPCGKEVIVNGTSQEMPCQFCHFFIMFDGIVDYLLFYVVFPLAVLLMVIGGLMFITASESISRIETARKLMTSTLIGIVIIFSAWLIINLFFLTIGISDFGAQFTGPGKWFTIDCLIELP